MGGWLTLRNYPFAVDLQKCKLIAFNLPLLKIAKIVKRYKPHSYTIEIEPRPPFIHRELYKFMDRAIGDKCTVCAEYYRNLHYGKPVSVPSRHDLSRLAFYDSNYPDALDARSRICWGLYSLDAKNPSQQADYDKLPKTISMKADDVIKNHLILSFHTLPEIHIGESCLGAEAWAFDAEAKQIIAFNVPTVMLSTIYDTVKPEALHYSELQYPQTESSVYQFIRNKIESIRERNNLTTDQRIPFIYHLQGVEIFNFSL